MAIQRVGSSFIQRFQALFAPREQQQTAITTVAPPERPTALMNLFAAEQGRRPLIDDCRRMYDEDTRAQDIIDTMASDSVKGAFELRVDGRNAKQAKQIADDLLNRIEFFNNIEQWIRETFIDGDTFLELGANSAGDIVEITRKPTLELHRWTNEYDRFIDPSRAFFWTDMMWNGGYTLDPPSDAVFFAEWQIIHARNNPRSNSRYGRPMFGSARKSYKRMGEGELDMAIRRKTRAGMKYLHTVEDGSEADIEAYKARNKAVLSDAFAAVADFFSSKKGSITAIQGDAHLSEYDDVLHHVRTWWMASPVPMSLLGYGQDLNRDVLDEQKEQYDGHKEQKSQWVAGQFVKPLIERQWLLKGIWPGSLDWDVEWSSKQPLQALMLKDAGDAMLKLKALGLPEETVIHLLSLFVPDMNADEVLKQMQMEQEAAMRDQAQRIAANANQIPVDPNTGLPVEQAGANGTGNQ